MGQNESFRSPIHREERAVASHNHQRIHLQRLQRLRRLPRRSPTAALWNPVLLGMTMAVAKEAVLGIDVASILAIITGTITRLEAREAGPVKTMGKGEGLSRLPDPGMLDPTVTTDPAEIIADNKRADEEKGITPDVDDMTVTGVSTKEGPTMMEVEADTSLGNKARTIARAVGETALHPTNNRFGIDENPLTSSTKDQDHREWLL